MEEHKLLQEKTEDDCISSSAQECAYSLLIQIAWSLHMDEICRKHTPATIMHSVHKHQTRAKLK